MLQRYDCRPTVDRYGTRYGLAFYNRPMALILIAASFEHLLTIHADTSQVPKLPRKMCSAYTLNRDRESRYFQQRFKVVLLFGMTELKAQIRWHEDVRTILSSTAG